MRTKREYLDSLYQKHRNLYLEGERIGRAHPALAFSAPVIGATNLVKTLAGMETE